MIVHTFICRKCNISVQDTDTKKIHNCPNCGEEMVWDLKGAGVPKGDYYHVSESLAIDPSQTQEHRQNWPNVDVLPDGRLGFCSAKEQEKYANHFGLEKKPQKLRR